MNSSQTLTLETRRNPVRGMAANMWRRALVAAANAEKDLARQVDAFHALLAPSGPQATAAFLYVLAF